MASLLPSFFHFVLFKCLIFVVGFLESVIRWFTVVVGDWMASDVADIRDLDELEVYGSEAQTSVQIASYVFEVCSVCICIIPLCDICLIQYQKKGEKKVYLCVE